MSGLGDGVALCFPFRNDQVEGRLANFEWLADFYKHALPGAEIVIGEDSGSPFSKTCALNNAFKKSHGDVIVLIDADCYIEPSVITQCAYRIRKARQLSERIWFVPYRHMYRLTREATAHLLASDPTAPWCFPVPPKPFDVGDTHGSDVSHWFGALVQLMPREAFEATGGMDPRFRGWGSEDVTFVRTLDTLYSHNRTTWNQVLALWHPQHGDTVLNRQWDNQTGSNVNKNISMRYFKEYRDPARMLKIIKEWQSNPAFAEHVICHV